MNTYTKSDISIEKRLLTLIISCVAAVALPQLLHVLGALVGIHSALGEILLPMHLPIMIAGSIGGASVGLISGASAVLISYLLTGMPSFMLLPFMMVEVAMYGWSMGMLKKTNIHPFLQVLSSQIIGRVIRAIIIIICVSLLHVSKLPISIIYTSIMSGALGILIQWIVVPFVIKKGN